MQLTLMQLFKEHQNIVASRSFLLADKRPGNPSLLEQLEKALERSVWHTFESSSIHSRINLPSSYSSDLQTQLDDEQSLELSSAFPIQEVSTEFGTDARVKSLLAHASMMLEYSDVWRPHHLATKAHLTVLETYVKQPSLTMAKSETKPTWFLLGPLDITMPHFIRLRRAVRILLYGKPLYIYMYITCKKLTCTKVQ